MVMHPREPELYKDSLRYRQLVQELDFEEKPLASASPAKATYRDSFLFQQMMSNMDLQELPNGTIVSREKAEEIQKEKLLERIGAITRMGCAECLREKLGSQRPLQEIAALIHRVRFGAACAEVYEPSPELIEDASVLEKLVQQARGRSNPKYSVRGLAGA